MSYSDKVIDHYNHPRNVGSMDKSSADVGTGLVGAPECGDVMKLQIKVNPETSVIEDAKFKTFGCGSAIASSSLATEWVKGKTIDEALAIKNTEIVKELALPPVKIHNLGILDRQGLVDQEYRDREGTGLAAGEDSLLGAGRGCDPSRDWRLEEEAGHREARGSPGGKVDRPPVETGLAPSQAARPCGDAATRVST